MIRGRGEGVGPTFQVRDILIEVPGVSRQITCGEVVGLMLSRPDVPCLVVVDDDNVPLGLVERDRLLVNFAHAIRAELYRRRPIASFVDVDALCVDADTHIDSVSALIATDYPRALTCGFIITDEGRYAGIGTGTGLLSAVVILTRSRSDELLRAEKLAALGSMVAGIAHEINTPLGNGLMVATTLSAKIADFREALAGSALRRSVLLEFSASLEQANELLMTNLTKAAELIGSFKRVAVDRTSELRRRFDLSIVCGEVVTTVRPAYKHTGYQIQIDIPLGIEMDSYPGALGQVVTNLINNAIIHGFEGRESGIVRVTGMVAGNDDERPVVLRVADNGKGIPANVLPRIFDPFFTTRLGSGGSGLGLHIVNALVMQVLDGVLTVDCPAAGGTCFTLALPRRVTAERAAQLAAFAGTGERGGDHGGGERGDAVNR